MIKLMTLVSLIVSVPFYFGASNTYNYSYYGEAIHSAPGMTFAAYINAQTLGTTLASPEDLVVFEDVIYLIDSDTNQLSLIDVDFQLLETHTTFDLSAEYLAELAEKGITNLVSITLDSPMGVDVTDSAIFIADTGNYRVVKLNHDFEVVAIFDEMEDDTFKTVDVNPVTEGDINFFLAFMVFDINEGMTLGDYCDQYFDPNNAPICRELMGDVLSDNAEIVDFSARDMGDYWEIKFLRGDGETPEVTDTVILDIRYNKLGDVIAYEYNDAVYFEPEKITVDPTDRMYIVAKNVYEGILEVNFDGSFNRFTGVNPIVLTPFEIFSRNLMTEEQLDQLQLFLPTEYTNVSIDDRNFIYATSRPSENNDENPIQLINPKGVDVIRRNGYFPPMGDVHYIIGMNNYVIDGPSTLVDIASTNYGIYTVLDQKRSRLFTYDGEGNLLYINGDEGSQSDKFSEGVALAYLGDDLLILDRGTKTIVVYRLTEFGQYVNQAIMFHSEGEFEAAAEVWQKVIQINTNYEIAYNGIGKLLLRQGQFKEAMEYFKLGHDQYYYSKAFREYRNEIIKDNFGWIIGSVVVLGGTIVGLKIRSVYKKGGSILYED